MLKQLSGIIGNLGAGNANRELHTEWQALNPTLRKIITAAPIAVGLIGVLLVLYVVLNWGGGSVLVSANTEYMEYTPLTEDPPIWYLPQATLHFQSKQKNNAGAQSDNATTDDIFSDDYVPDPMLTVPVSAAFLELSCGDAITVNRIANSDISVSVSRLSDSDAGIVDIHGAIVPGTEDIPLQFSVQIPIDDSYDTAGKSLNWPMAGLITAGRSVKNETTDSRGLLTSGTVQVMAKHLLAPQHYLVESYELQIGDQVVLPSLRELVRKTVKLKSASEIEQVKKENCSRTVGSDNGFINIDPSGGLNTVISSRSEHAEVERYKTATLYVGNSLIKRFLNDQWFTVAWTLIIAFFVSYRRIVRSILASNDFKSGVEDE